MNVNLPTISARKLTPSGAWELTALMPQGYLVSRQFIGYTKREAERLFRDFLRANI